MSEREDRGFDGNIEFDVLLRSALDSYADPGPDARLAQRVLARVAAERERKSKFRWLPWAIALPAAALLLILITLFGARPPHGPIDGADKTSHAHVSEPPSAPTTGVERPSISNSPPRQPAEVSPVNSHLRRDSVDKTESLPKLAVFPTPQPLTPAERALVEYAVHAPQTDRQALIETQKQIEEPLSIAAIQIQPLEPPNDGGN